MFGVLLILAIICIACPSIALFVLFGGCAWLIIDEFGWYSIPILILMVGLFFLLIKFKDFMDKDK